VMRETKPLFQVGRRDRPIERIRPHRPLLPDRPEVGEPRGEEPGGRLLGVILRQCREEDLQAEPLGFADEGPARPRRLSATARGAVLRADRGRREAAGEARVRRSRRGGGGSAEARR
jgi:hypothetical protein